MRPSLGESGFEGHRPHDVGRPRLLSIWRLGPPHLVEVDEVHGPPTGQERVALGEGGAWPHQHPGAEGGVELVAAEGHVVGLARDGPVRGQLGGVEDDGNAAVVSGLDDGGKGWQPSRHVRGTGEGEDARPWRLVQAGDDVVEVEDAVGTALDVTPARHASPRQQVGVMLHHGGEHHVVGVEAEAVGEMVERLGGVATQDGDVAVASGRPLTAPGEGEGGVPGRLVGRGGEARLVPGAPVHARVRGYELLDGGHDGGERAGRGGGVEVHVAALDAVDTGDVHIVTHQPGRRVHYGRHGWSLRAYRRAPRRHRPVPSLAWNTTSSGLTS